MTITSLASVVTKLRGRARRGGEWEGGEEEEEEKEGGEGGEKRGREGRRN